jgi:CDP-diacylglycerol--glycerol-3-phosphate 3-phosphatidyltransferase
MTALPGSRSAATSQAGPAVPSAIRRTLPNTLTAVRVVMAVLVLAVLTFWRFESSAAEAHAVDWWLIFAAALFITATLTDALDGHLARRWGTETAFGRIMDPFADKLLVIGALVFLAGPDFWVATPEKHRFIGHGFQLSGIYPWMVVVIVGRELLVTSIRGVLEGQGVRFGADVWGKLKMLTQSVAVPTVLITIAVTDVLITPDHRPWGRWLIDSAVWTMVLVTALSGLPYILRALAHFFAWNQARKAP